MSKLVRVNLYPEEAITKFNGEDGWLKKVGMFFPKRYIDMLSYIGRTILVLEDVAEKHRIEILESYKKGDE